MKRSRRAFASLVAVALIGLIGVTVGAIFALIATDYRHTQAADLDAQSRQLLLAGAIELKIEMQSWDETAGAASKSIELPQSLRDQGAKLELTISPAPDSGARATIEAHIRNHHSSQTIELARSGKRWIFRSAQLSG